MHLFFYSIAALMIIGAIFLVRPRPCNRVLAVNIAEKPHDSGRVTMLTDAAFTARYLLAAEGSDADHIKVGTAADRPLGIVLDEPAQGAGATVDLLGASPGTKLVVASAAIAAKTDVFAAAGGKVQELPVGAGTYWQVGRTLKAAGGDNQRVEIVPCFPRSVTVTGG